MNKELATIEVMMNMRELVPLCDEILEVKDILMMSISKNRDGSITMNTFSSENRDDDTRYVDGSLYSDGHYRIHDCSYTNAEFNKKVSEMREQVS